MSTESCLIKLVLAVRLIHRFTSPFQFRQLQHSMVLQLAAAERTKKKACKQASYWQCPYKSMLRHTIVSPHNYTHISIASDGGSIFKGGGRPKPMTRFSSPTTRAGRGVARNFKWRRGVIISTFFSSVFFSAELICS